jgi:Uncharacterized protein conserved in bacteria (DUF2252)
MTTSTRLEHLAFGERKAHGKALRDKVPVGSHEGWTTAAEQPDPVALLEEQTPLASPISGRHDMGRMLVWPFTFYRGAAKTRAADLQATPRAQLDSQPCGDAHLSNSRVYASPERSLRFELSSLPSATPCRGRDEGTAAGPDDRAFRGTGHAPPAP